MSEFPSLSGHIAVTVTGLDLSPAAIKAAECRTCEICDAKPKQRCENTIRIGDPLPGRDVHYGRLGEMTDTGKAK